MDKRRKAWLRPPLQRFRDYPSLSYTVQLDETTDRTLSGSPPAMSRRRSLTDLPPGSASRTSPPGMTIVTLLQAHFEGSPLRACRPISAAKTLGPLLEDYGAVCRGSRRSTLWGDHAARASCRAPSLSGDTIVEKGAWAAHTAARLDRAVRKLRET